MVIRIPDRAASSRYFSGLIARELKTTALDAKTDICELLIRLQVQNQILQMPEYSKVTKMSRCDPTPTFNSWSFRIKFVYAQLKC